MVLTFFQSPSNTIDANLRIEEEIYPLDEAVNISRKNYESARAAERVQSVHAFDKVIGLTFDGMVDSQTTQKIIALLDKYDSNATFFLPGIKSAEDSETVQNIMSSGQEIGNYTLSAQTGLDTLDIDAVISDFAKANVILESITGQSPNLLKVNNSQYTPAILKAVSASNIEAVVDSSKYLNYQSFSSPNDATHFVDNLEAGLIISIKTDSYLSENEVDSVESEEGNIEEFSEESSTEDIPEEESDQEKNDKLIEVVEYLLKALAQDNYKIVNITELSEVDVIDSNKKDYLALAEENKGEIAELTQHFFTTQPAISYTFSDLSDSKIVNSVLDTLEKLKIKATFFVTGVEIQEHQELIQDIVDRGHQLANAGYGQDNSNPTSMDFERIAYEIDMGERFLRHFLGEQYDEKVNKLYMPLYGSVNDTVLEAASSLGYDQVFTYNRTLMRQDYQKKSSDEMMDDYFANVYSLHRGDIVHFRMNYLEQDGAVEELVEKVASHYIFPTNYTIEPLAEMNNNPAIYQPKSRLDIAQNNDIVYSFGKDSEELEKLIMANYIGNPNINSSETLHGFTDKQIAQINTEGEINTAGDKVIFLTFDDWGSDLAINPILDVLNKYNAKASFYVRVGSLSVDLDDNFQNPNLLRAIALEGHDVENHSFKHITVDIKNNEEVDRLRNDLLSAQYELERYLYDTGAIHNYFRPPTLAVSKLGLETIFDMGYEYVINGNFSTHDYEAESVDQLANDLINGLGEGRTIESGSIIVMHMSDEAQYTAEALDKVIPYYQKQGYEFVKLSDYLVDGYTND